ncbi:MAG: DUF4469 domain-containing protein [Bacteroidales bacterium]|jgi:hypothetical protein|nr:DUF4469 domain-containing protein [Bacteroidales bacterium]
MAILHKIKAWLYRNNLLTSKPNEYIIRPVSDRTLGVREICETAVTRGKADISASAIEHGVILFLKEMEYQLYDGFSVNTGWFTAKPQIRGIADSPKTQYDKEKHTLLFEFHQGAILRRGLENVEVEILGVAESGTIIVQVTDAKTGSVNDLLTPNRNLKIAGSKIKITGNNAANGVYFVNIDTAERTKVDDSDIILNNPSELIVLIPELKAGTYLVEVTTQYGSNSKTVLKEPRTVIFDRELTVH